MTVSSSLYIFPVRSKPVLFKTTKSKHGDVCSKGYHESSAAPTIATRSTKNSEKQELLGSDATGNWLDDLLGSSTDSGSNGDLPNSLDDLLGSAQDLEGKLDQNIEYLKKMDGSIFDPVDPKEDEARAEKAHHLARHATRNFKKRMRKICFRRASRRRITVCQLIVSFEDIKEYEGMTCTE
ncbi:unnamed protein product [Phytophthora lilii]|uniref:Unnamed protein product n=1 Tax=Phytophthora lilii TaxID=2077276 RepID=A0A9W6U0T2_9STRA|nr:unnamed protein product [Phytophthora lilii]